MLEAVEGSTAAAALAVHLLEHALPNNRSNAVSRDVLLPPADGGGI
jgi:hypothetical protein